MGQISEEGSGAPAVTGSKVLHQIVVIISQGDQRTITVSKFSQSYRNDNTFIDLVCLVR